MDTYKKILEGDLAWPSDVRVSVESGQFALHAAGPASARACLQP